MSHRLKLLCRTIGLLFEDLLLRSVQQLRSGVQRCLKPLSFYWPQEVLRPEYLPLAGDFMSFNEVVATLNRQGHNFSFNRLPKEVFAGLFPGAAEIAEMFGYFQAHTYLGSDSRDHIALATKIAGRQPAESSAWAQVNFPTPKNTNSAAR
jgi:hypothetical protein